MKKRILIVLSALMVFGLVAVVFAYNRSGAAHHTADSCCATANCCAGGECKMNGACCAKHKHESVSTEKKDSCPMKNKETATAASVEMNNVVVASDTENCCSGGSCCDGGACCKKEKSTS